MLVKLTIDSSTPSSECDVNNSQFFGPLLWKKNALHQIRNNQNQTLEFSYDFQLTDCHYIKMMYKQRDITIDWRPLACPDRTKGVFARKPNLGGRRRPFAAVAPSSGRYRNSIFQTEHFHPSNSLENLSFKKKSKPHLSMNSTEHIGGTIPIMQQKSKPIKLGKTMSDYERFILKKKNERLKRQRSQNKTWPSNKCKTLWNQLQPNKTL